MPWPELAKAPPFDLVVALLAGLCVAAVLLAVVANHLAARHGGAVEVRRRSPVATASMLGFFLAYLVVLRLRVGVVPMERGVARSTVMLAGLALLVAGCAVNLVGRLGLGRNWADQVTVYREQTLVRNGVFGVVRHPLYASLIWMFVGGSLLYRSAAALALTLAIFLPAMVVRARQEETLLAQRFPEYAAYRQQVGMLLPRVRFRR
jgi:protein-S-isoprenylcysteine O-methyltransferase Ste14